MEQMIRETYQIAESIKDYKSWDFLNYRNSFASLVTNFILNQSESNRKPTVDIFEVQYETEHAKAGDIMLFVQLNQADVNDFADYSFTPSENFSLPEYQGFISRSISALNNIRRLGKIDTEKSKILLSLAFDFGSGKEIYSGNLSAYLGRSGNILN
jgi:hypothetical protein